MATWWPVAATCKLFRCTLVRYIRLVIIVCICYLLLHLLLLPPPPDTTNTFNNNNGIARVNRADIAARTADTDTPSTAASRHPAVDSINASLLPAAAVVVPSSRTRGIKNNINISDTASLTHHMTRHSNNVSIGSDAEKPGKMLAAMPSPGSVEEVRQWMVEQNRRQWISPAGAPPGYNYTSSSSSPIPPPRNHTIIIVQVHNRTEYLRHLIESLRKVRGIKDVLLIFSHDYYSPEINHIINAITFCRVLQIFYPHNMQIYPHTFPGVDPRDCPRDMKRPQAVAKGCLNALHPDKFGHYREAKYCQTKHHWFWKLQFVFESVSVVRNHTGLFLFIEEDHYITDDGLHVLHMMQALRNRSHAECNVLCLGDYSKKLPKKVDSNKVDILMWLSNKHNMGMAFDINTYHAIKLCSHMFCTYDDYNWDWSLMYISQKCMLPKLVVMTTKVARVLHIGECGLHKKSKECEPKSVISRIETSFKKSFNMFPDSLTVGVKKLNALKMPKVNGGWGDVRDHSLCQNYTDANLALLQR